MVVIIMTLVVGFQLHRALLILVVAVVAVVMVGAQQVMADLVLLWPVLALLQI